MKDEIASRFEDPFFAQRAIARGVRDALVRHKRLGESIAVLRDGEVVVVPPEEIEIPEIDDAD